MFTKDDLKTGMVVELRNGERYIVMRNFETKCYGLQNFILSSKNSFHCSVNYNYNLISIRDSQCDIMKVCEETHYLDTEDLGKPIYQREEKTQQQIKKEKIQKEMEELAKKQIELAERLERLEI